MQTNLTAAEMLAIKDDTFALVGFHGLVEFTAPGDGAASLWRFEDFSPTKNSGNDYTLSVTLREALGF